ncbi:MAG: prepilin-type N-terminal cleavage/methylation domain-containing protein, partial [Nitrospira sp.]|nr:prepilin-type N-terminal cleavage/methylation domain-containing protein [Nitrospira sp.]
MKRRRAVGSRVTAEAGFTLLELMIGMAIAAIIVAAGFTILTTTSKSLTVNEQTGDMQQNVRLAMELLTRDIKRAGFGAPGVPIGACVNGIVPGDQNATGADTGPDSVQLLVPATKTTGTDRWTLTAATGSGGISSVTLQPGAVTDMVNSGLVANTSYVSIGGAATVLVTGFATGAST